MDAKRDRGRAPPILSWRRLVHFDTGGFALIAMFFGTLVVLGTIVLLASDTSKSVDREKALSAAGQG